MSNKKRYAFGDYVATEPYKQQSIDAKVIGGMMAPIKTGGQLVPLKVVFGGGGIPEDGVVWVQGDNWAAVWAKRILEIDGQKFILVPTTEVVLVEYEPDDIF